MHILNRRVMDLYVYAQVITLALNYRIQMNRAANVKQGLPVVTCLWKLSHVQACSAEVIWTGFI